MPAILEACVREVMADGHDEASAWAICRTSLNLSYDSKDVKDIKNITEEEMKQVKERALTISKEIKDGKRKFAVPESFNIEKVPIFAAGKWNGENYTEKDLDDMVSAFEETKDYMKPYLKLGHDGNQKLVQSDGMPAAGWIEKIYKIGQTLYADFAKVPKKIYDLVLAGAYKKISSEIWWNFNFNGKKYRRMLKAASFLGSDWPAVSTLDDIISLYMLTGEVKQYGDDKDIFTVEIEKHNIYKKEDCDMDELQKQLADANKKLAESEVKLKEFSAREEKFKALESENTELKSKMEKIDGENKELNQKISEFAVKEKEASVNAIINKAIDEKKVTPAQKDYLFAILMNSDNSKKYKMGESEKTMGEIIQEFVKNNSSDVNTDGESELGQSRDITDDKVKAYAEKNKVSYREAYIALSPVNK